MMTDRLEQLLQLLNEDPSDSFIRFAIAKEYEKSGQEAKARSYFESLMRDDPQYIGTYYHLGQLLSNMDRIDAAKEVLGNGIQQAREQKDRHAEGELRELLLVLD